MIGRVIESPRGGYVVDGGELRRAAEFLQDLEENLASPLTDTASIPLSVSVLKIPRSTNSQETHSVPPLATLQPADLADLFHRG
jgi:predicted sugar kinase